MKSIYVLTKIIDIYILIYERRKEKRKTFACFTEKQDKQLEEKVERYINEKEEKKKRKRSTREKEKIENELKVSTVKTETDLKTQKRVRKIKGKKRK